MVVVDNARKMIGKTIDIVVTSVLQTTAGKMIFGRFIDRRQRPRRRRPPSRDRTPRPGAAAAAARGATLQHSRIQFRLRSLRFTGGGRSSSSFRPSRVYTIVCGAASIVSSLFDQ